MTALPASLAAPSRPLFSSRDAAMAFVVLAWGTNFVVLKTALTVFPPLGFNALRFTAAALGMLALLYAREGLGQWPDRRTLLKLLGLGLVGNTLYQYVFILGLAKTSAAHAGMIVTSTPVLVACFSAMGGLERIHRRLASGIALGVLGMSLVLAMRNADESGASVAGDLILLSSCICWSLYTVGVKTLGNALSPLRITTLTMAAGAPGLLLIGGTELVAMEWSAVPASGWALLAYATVVPLVLAYIVWNASIQHVGPARTAIYNCAIPVVAVATGWAVFDEQPAALQIIGAALVLAGVLRARTQRVVDLRPSPSNASSP